VEHGAVGFTEAQAVESHAQFHIATNGGQFARQRQDALVFAQAFANFSRHFCRLGQQFVQRAVLPQPLGGGFGTDLRDAWNVIRGVAHQSQIVDDLLGPDVELRLDARAVHDAAAHGVDKRDAIVDELRHVLVAGGDADLQSLCSGGAGKRADDIVRFHAADTQQGQA